MLFLYWKPLSKRISRPDVELGAFFGEPDIGPEQKIGIKQGERPAEAEGLLVVLEDRL